MTHPHHTTGRPCNCGFTKYKAKPRGNKFFTSTKDHKRNKALYNMRWGFPNKRGAADPEWLEQYMKEHGPYMYHGTDPETVKKIVQEGLYPHDHEVLPEVENGRRVYECGQCGSQFATLRDGQLEPQCYNCGSSSEHAVPRTNSRSNFSGFLAPRSGHVYLGDYVTSSRYAKDNTSPLLRVDLRKLDPSNMNADEDHFGHPEIYPVVDKVWQDDPPPDPEYYEGGEGLGAWADRINLGGYDPEETHHSMRQGSMAYNGMIPPEAIEMDTVHRGWSGMKPSPETAWKAMHQDDYVSRPKTYPPIQETLGQPMPTFAATDSNHWEGKMWHGNNKGLLGDVRTPFWTTSHKPEANGFGDTVHPVSVRFKNPAYYFGKRTRGDIEMAQAAGNDGIVVHYPENDRDPSDLYPARQWAIALDPGTIVPGHDHEFPY